MKMFAMVGFVMSVMVVSLGAAPAVGGETKIVLEGSTTVGPIAKAFAEHHMEANKHVNITVGESGSGNGVKALVNSTCDIATMSRFLKPEEFKAAVYNNVFPVVHVVALDGLPVLVHPSNPVKGLTVEQLRDIYAGKITSWKEVGGPDVKIVKISRDTNSGTYEAFEMMVMRGERIAKDAEYVGSNGAVRDRVQKTPAAIGYAGLGFVDDSVRALDINGVHPSRATVMTGRYPISRPLYFVTNGYPKLGSHIHALTTLHLTKKGQEIVEAIGFVPVTSYPEK